MLIGKALHGSPLITGSQPDGISLRSSSIYTTTGYKGDKFGILVKLLYIISTTKWGTGRGVGKKRLVPVAAGSRLCILRSGKGHLASDPSQASFLGLSCGRHIG